MEQTKQNGGKALSFADFFRTVKKHWLVETIILAAFILAGVIYGGFIKKPYYVAKEEVTVKVDVNNSYYNTILEERLVKTISKLFKTDTIVELAKAESGNSDIYASNITVKSDETLIMSVSYKDSSKELAELKLEAILSAAESENTKDYFSAKATVRPMGVITTSQQSDSTKIIVIGVAAGVVLSLVYAFIRYMAEN